MNECMIYLELFKIYCVPIRDLLKLGRYLQGTQLHAKEFKGRLWNIQKLKHGGE